VIAHDRGVACCRGDLVVSGFEPPGGVSAEANPAGVWVNVEVATDCGLYLREVCLCLTFGREGLGPLSSGFIVVPSGCFRSLDEVTDQLAALLDLSAVI